MIYSTQIHSDHMFQIRVRLYHVFRINTSPSHFLGILHKYVCFKETYVCDIFYVDSSLSHLCDVLHEYICFKET